MKFEKVRDPILVGPHESLPDYGPMCKTLLHRHHNQPFVERSEVDELLGERGNTESLLLEFVRMGYVLHGSPVRVEQLEPRQARDLGGDPRNMLKGVYAGVTPSESIFMSFLGKGIGGGTSVTHHSEYDLTIPSFRAHKELSEFPSSGYMYVLDRSRFVPTHEGSETQFCSPVAVRPTLVIPVNLSDFHHEVEMK